jgi:8-oxo-dGTP diphosphatase
MENKKHEIRVVCAVIKKDGRFLALRRKPGEKREGFWEFPGGKMEVGETPEYSLIREIREELGIGILPGKALRPVRHEYDDLAIILMPYICEWIDGSISLSVHDGYRWLTMEETVHMDWCEADADVLRDIEMQI